MAYIQLLFLMFAMIMSLGFFVYVGTSFFIFLKTGVSSKSSHYSDILNVIEHFNLSEKDVLYDLGSGDGRFILHAVHKTGCSGIGYEISTMKHVIAKVASRIFGLSDKTTFYLKNVEKADLSKADALFCSLSPKMLKRLKGKFEKELKDGVKIISETYPIPKIAANEIAYSGKFRKKKYHIYTYYKETF